MRCLDMGVIQVGSTFNYAYNIEWGYPRQFEAKTWLSKQDLEKALLNIEGSDHQGDIFAKAPG